MSGKKWSILYILVIVLAVAGIMLVNYIVDPYKYFAAQGGDNYTLDESDHLRELKAEHIKNFPDQYDAYLVGGSRGGAILTSKLHEMDGHNYYNCWLLSGRFSDYLAYIRYIAENTSAKKVLLQISSSELSTALIDEDRGPIYELPAEISGENKGIEFIKMLMKNPRVSATELMKTQPKINHSCLETGERDLKKYYNFQNKDTDAFYDFIMTDSERLYQYLFSDYSAIQESIDVCISTLKEIKQVCKDHNIELQVFIAPLFLPQLLQYEGDDYYEFLERVVMLFDEGKGIWNFNDYNPLINCPYNFYNTSHFYYDMADLMIDTMAGKANSYGFGQKLTRQNVGTIIKERKEKFKYYKDYYTKTLSLPYEMYDSQYNLTKNSSHYKKKKKKK